MQLRDVVFFITLVEVSNISRSNGMLGRKGGRIVGSQR